MPQNAKPPPLCIDSEATIPHRVDNRRAKRCDQHLHQRKMWQNANNYKAKNNQPLADWKPDDLEPRRRHQAELEFGSAYSSPIADSIKIMKATLGALDQLKPALPTPRHKEHLAAGLRRLSVQLDYLETVAYALDRNTSKPPPPPTV